MAKILKFKRGNTAKNNAYTGSAGELTVDTTKKTVVVHDGVTTGGSVLATDVTVSTHTSRVDNPHSVSKTQVGLGNVLNVDSTNPNNIVQDSTHRFVTDSDKTNWNGKINATEKAVANGVATLDVNGKVVLTQIPDSVLGQLEYMGTYSFSGGMPTATQKGQYWIASADGNGYITGDWAVWNGTSFDKVDNTDAVATVAGRTGNVVLTKNDVGLSNVDNTSDMNKPISTATQTALDLKADKSTTYTKTELNNGQLDNRYYTETEIDNALDLKVTKVTSTDNAIVRFDGTTGGVQNSGVTIDDGGNLNVANTLIATQVRVETGSVAVAIGGWDTVNHRFEYVNRPLRIAGYGTNTDIIFANNNDNEKMIIKSSGNLLIGTSTDNGVDKLQVNGTVISSRRSGAYVGNTLFYSTFNDNLSHSVTCLANQSFIVEISSASGVHSFPVYCFGGNGIGYSFNYLNPGTGIWVNTSGNNLSLVFTEQGTSPNTYAFSIISYNGTSTIQATTQNSSYSICITTI